MNRHRRRKPTRLDSVESLERREMLHGGQPVWGEAPQLTLSFASDGAPIAGEDSVLVAEFDDRFGEGKWQETILKAFQTWAIHTNANIGVVNESGIHAFGTPGARTGDPRFGDIRIGARPLSSNVAAVSVSHDSVVSGTWAGDIVFNSEAEFDTLEDLFSIALHEAGHTFGLEHSEDADSPMHIHGVSAATEPTEADIESIVELYGERSRDAFEGRDGNSRLALATPLPLNRAGSMAPGTAPTIIFADLTTNRDVDHYRIRKPNGYSGPVTVSVATDGFSLAKTNLRVFDRRGNELHPEQSEDGKSLTINSDDRDLAFRIDSDRDDVFAIGAYSLTITFDELNQVDTQSLFETIQSRFSHLENDDVDSYFNSGRNRFYNDHKDRKDEVNPFEQAREVIRSRRSDRLVSFTVVGSIEGGEEIDFYRVLSPESHFADASTAYISVRSLDAGSLIPEIIVIDQRRNVIETETLVNGNGELIVQIPNVQPETQLLIGITSASSLDQFQQGNYELNARFSESPTVVDSFVSGSVANQSATTHRLHVATTQLFHFALTVDGNDSKSGVLINLVDENDRVIHSIVSPQGKTRTAGSALLLPGTYSLVAIPLSSSGDEQHPTQFSLNGVAISDPFGIDPVLPEDTEFTCPDVKDEYCFPDGTQSTSPFDWEDFLVLLEDFHVDLSAVNDLILSEWWDAYWDSTESIEAPRAESENYDTAVDQPLEISATSGVLANDSSDNPIVIASIVRQPAYGTIDLGYDGSFTYVPPTDFEGYDSFQYIASDLRNQSEIVTVTIAVGDTGILGDATGDGVVDAADIDAVATALRTSEADAFDINADGAADESDRNHLIVDILGSTFGDSNLDGRFDSSDFVVAFTFGQYEDGIEGNSTWESGDWNGDGEFTSRDFVLAFQMGDYFAAANSAAQPSTSMGSIAASLEFQHVAQSDETKSKSNQVWLA